jgi:hypothetical protein
MTLPNPCIAGAHGDPYAAVLCHELGHVNGWPGNPRRLTMEAALLIWKRIAPVRGPRDRPARHPARHPEGRDAPLEEAKSARFEQLYRGEVQAHSRRRSPTIARRGDRPAPTIAAAERVKAEQTDQRGGRTMTSRHALPMLALALLLPLEACSTTPKPQAIPALAEQRQCPAYPLPPAALIKPPVKTDFLPPTR